MPSRRHGRQEGRRSNRSSAPFPTWHPFLRNNTLRSVLLKPKHPLSPRLLDRDEVAHTCIDVCDDASRGLLTVIMRRGNYRLIAVRGQRRALKPLKILPATLAMHGSPHLSRNPPRHLRARPATTIWRWGLKHFPELVLHRG